MSAVTVRVMMHSEAEAPEAVGTEQQVAEESLSFYSGNPRVERVSGVVHLYGSVVGEVRAAGAVVPSASRRCRRPFSSLTQSAPPPQVGLLQASAAFDRHHLRPLGAWLALRSA